MQGENKTLEKLLTIEKTINDLVEMRTQIIELKASEAQRQAALLKLQSVESKYRILAENIPLKLFIKDKNSMYIFCNQNFAQDLKIEPDQIVGKTDYDFFSRDIAEKYSANDRIVMETGKAEEIEDVYAQNGQEKVVHIVKTPVRDEQGDISGVLGIFWDVTEQKQREEDLKKDRDNLHEQISEYERKLQTFHENFQRENKERRAVEEELSRLKQEFKESRYNLEKRISEGTTALQTASGELQREISERKRIEEDFRRTEEELRKSCLQVEGQFQERSAELRAAKEQLQSIQKEHQNLKEKLQVAGENLRAVEGQLNARTIECQAGQEQLKKEIEERRRLEYERGVVNEQINTMQRLIQEHKTEWQLVKEQLQKETKAHEQLKEELRRKEAETDRLMRENAVAAEIGKIAASTVNLKEVYEHFSEFASEVGKIISFDRIAATILNPEDKTLNITYVTGLDMANRRAGDVLPISGTSAEEIMRTRSGLIIRKENQEEALGRFPDLLNYFEAGFQSLLFVPLLWKDQVIGILNFLSTKPNVYSPVDLRLAEKVGNQIGGAIANGQRFLEEKREEERLRASEKKFNSGLSLAPVGIWVGVQEKIIFANPKCAEILGYSREEFMGRPLTEFLHHEDQNRVIGKYSCRAKGEALPDYYVARFIDKQGRTKWLEVRAASIQWEGMPAMISFVNDVTERKQAEETLRNAVEPFRTLVQSIENMVYTLKQEKE